MRSVMVGVAVVVFSAPVWGAPAIELPAFSATPQELLAAAKAAPAGDWPTIVLRADDDTSFDDAGRATVRSHQIYVVRTQAGIDDWDSVAAGWSPFYQDKPSVRARVIDPSGKIAELDPTLFKDSPAVETSPTIFSDRRTLRAPLPHLAIGSVVEEETVTVDRQPILPSGEARLTWVYSSVPAQSTRIAFSAPAARKAHLIARALPKTAKPWHEVKQGRERWVYELGVLAAAPDVEPSAPSDAIDLPYVGIATAPSWAAVAHDYKRVVDQRIADGPMALPAELPHAATVETVRAIAAWLHHQVRYTGIELGEASNIPWPPAEVVKRGFGDCKDKATLLVSLLRGAGIRADVALLDTGPATDVDADLPGMGIFDHAIVRAMLGVTPLWIDPTEELLVAGRLPARDQGRRALVIADDTTALVTTPADASRDTVTREVRTFEVAEAGASRIVEVSREGGEFEADARAWIRDTRADDVKQQLAKYLDKEYGVEGIERWSSTATNDVAVPFELTAIGRDASRVWTSQEHVTVYLYPSATLMHVPPWLKRASDKPRVHDYVWFHPHTYQVENRILVPSGYTMPVLPPDRTRALGPASLTESYKVDGSTLVVTFTLDTGKARISPTDVAALQQALVALDKETTHLELAQSGLALERQGKPREAIAEIERLIQLHPKEALHHDQLATVLIWAGMGSAARREARRAVALEPKLAMSHAVLAWVLEYDTIGRTFTFDWDRAGSIAEAKQAMALDPKHAIGAQELGQTLERDSLGRMYEAGADLAGAAKAWRALDSAYAALAAAKALIAAGDFAQAETVLRARPAEVERDQLLVAAVAGTAGAPAAIQLAGQLRGSDRSTTINAAAGRLMLSGDYELARALFAETGGLSAATPELTAMFQNIARLPPPKAGSADPRDAVIEFLLIAIDPARPKTVLWDAQLAKRTAGFDMMTMVPASVKGFALIRFGSDFLRAGLTTHVEGDHGLWRVEVTVPTQKPMIAYVALDHGAAKVFAAPPEYDGAGRFLFHLLDVGDDAGARRMLDWWRADIEARTDPAGVAAKQLWGPGIATNRDQIALAAAVLADLSVPARSLPLIHACKPPGMRAVCDLAALRLLYNEKRWAELDTVMAEALPRHTTDKALFVATRATALARLGRFDDADKLLSEALAADPDSRELLHASAQVAFEHGQLAEAIKRMDRATTRAKPDPWDFNNAAWMRITEPTEATAGLELARKAVALAKDNAGILNTLAALDAETGDPGRARIHGWHAIELRHATTPNDSDWYVVGRIAEQLGLREDAIAAYKHADQESRDPGSSYDLARRRLAALHAK